MTVSADTPAAPPGPSLAALASRATPGPWRVIYGGPRGCLVDAPGITIEVTEADHDDVGDAAVQYIAAAHPAAVLGLLARVAALEAALRTLLPLAEEHGVDVDHGAEVDAARLALAGAAEGGGRG